MNSPIYKLFQKAEVTPEIIHLGIKEGKVGRRPIFQRSEDIKRHHSSISDIRWYSASETIFRGKS